MPGDDLLTDAVGTVTHFVDIQATPAQIWPWLVQMGCRRGGFYSLDLLDNANRESAREIHPELQDVRVGDVLPAAPEADQGFEVLAIDEPHAFVLGGLFDRNGGGQLPFASPRPEHYWHVTWAFILQPLDGDMTRLHARARAAASSDEGWHLATIQPMHHIMERAQLEGIKRRVEHRMPREGWRDVAEGIVGAAGIVLDLLTPFLRPVRTHWGLDEATAEREYPGDDLVSDPRWGWTHGVEIDALPEEVWPWVVQIGADRGGFYSYQWLENLVGCDVKNAETIHPEMAHELGSQLLLHPDMPGLDVVRFEPGHYFVAHGAPRPQDIDEGRPWASFSWGFYVEKLPDGRSLFISRVRFKSSDDLATRISFGPYFTESVGFVMDRRMLLGVKDRVEARKDEAVVRRER